MSEPAKTSVSSRSSSLVAKSEETRMFSQAIYEQETQQAFQRRSPTLLINFKNYDHVFFLLLRSFTRKNKRFA